MVISVLGVKMSPLYSFIALLSFNGKLGVSYLFNESLAFTSLRYKKDCLLFCPILDFMNAQYHGVYIQSAFTPGGLKPCTLDSLVVLRLQGEM